MFHAPNQYRIRTGPLASCDDCGNNGAFALPPIIADRRILTIASDGMEWEHVSVHVELNTGKTRMPAWDEMCRVKEVFWDPEDTVMQLHPPKSQWINNHRTTLHLWRPLKAEMPLPPGITVGFKELGEMGG